MSKSCGMKLAFGLVAEVPELPKGWTVRQRKSSWLVLIDEKGHEYFYGAGICYPLKRATAEKHKEVPALEIGQKYIDTKNVLILDEIRKAGK